MDTDLIEFDFIVVGGGSSGCLIASRLSEVPEWNVLLLEAGGDPPITSENPILWSNHLKSKIDWNFPTEKCEIYQGMEDGVYSYPRGRVLGGCSIINAMIYLRGTKENFNFWERCGCTGWGFDSVLPYFKKFEDFVDSTRFNPEIHAQGNELTVSPLETYDPAYKVFVEAEKSLNLNRIEDFNIIEPTVGYGDFDSTIRNGRRCSTLKAFLLPASDRTNLYVAKNVLVTRIICIDNKAIGVEYLSPSLECIKSVYCTKEVIISAGPMKSAQLLMLSGIGPKEHLTDLGIPVLQDLLVGFNLIDHISYPPLVFSDRKFNRTKEEIQNESTDLLNKLNSYFHNNIGTMGISQLLTFIKTKEELIYPNIQTIMFRVPYNLSYGTPNNKSVLSNLFGYSDEIGKSFEKLNLLSDVIVTMPIVLQPKSTGRIMLRSRDPLDNPKIFANYLSEQEDRNTLVDGIEFILKLAKTKPMIEAGLILEKLQLKPCDKFDWCTREYWMCAIEYLSAPFFHCVGTCRMGSYEDYRSVVDPTLKVKGICGLRVADSSVMYYIPSVNVNAATLMIAEKASCMIKEEYLGK